MKRVQRRSHFKVVFNNSTAITSQLFFDDAVLHGFFHKSERAFCTRTKSNRNVPQVRVDPRILPDSFSANVPLA